MKSSSGRRCATGDELNQCLAYLYCGEILSLNSTFQMINADISHHLF